MPADDLQRSACANDRTPDQTPSPTSPRVDSELSDDSLANLFASFDEVRASDDLKDATMKAIFEKTGLPADKPKPVAVTDLRKGRQSRLRRVRIAALAACLALALSGGVAYAAPSAHVQVSSDGSTVDLGINVFGLTVSATSDDKSVQAALDEAGLGHRPAGEALDKAYTIVKNAAPKSQVSTKVEGIDPGQRARLEADAEDVRARHEMGPDADMGASDESGAPERPSPSEESQLASLSSDMQQAPADGSADAAPELPFEEDLASGAGDGASPDIPASQAPPSQEGMSAEGAPAEAASSSGASQGKEEQAAESPATPETSDETAPQQIQNMPGPEVSGAGETAGPGSADPAPGPDPAGKAGEDS